MVDSNSIRNSVDSAADVVERAATVGRHAIEEGYESAREYGGKSLDYLEQVGGGLGDFIKREPLLAVGAAFLVGYIAAQMFRRVPS